MGNSNEHVEATSILNKVKNCTIMLKTHTFHWSWTSNVWWLLCFLWWVWTKRLGIRFGFFTLWTRII